MYSKKIYVYVCSGADKLTLYGMTVSGGIMKFLKHFFVAVLLVCSVAHAENPKEAGIPLNVKQYSELGKFGVPRPMSLSVVKFNGKTYILSDMPDRRLYDLTLNRAKDGREVLCGKKGKGLKVANCYYIFFREK
ncbi:MULTISPECIES: hypothetical protein [Enterobacteriaceae]|nr:MULTISPECIES: hypothetical protein [Enterobacteriaceae]EDF6232717.1 hypothetical protein [Salmonella enterica subsp. enterica serovar Senftenberg]ELK0756165.1 hypothetical protein [Klebsiella oxytoca]RXK65140.1 hypothetical protein ET141_27380 [Klebsiella pneumoniae]HDU3837906.1 hypothetical protein [Klebsiella pneumoniae subsp. pneumoniae]